LKQLVFLFICEAQEELKYTHMADIYSICHLKITLIWEKESKFDRLLALAPDDKFLTVTKKMGDYPRYP